MYPQLEASVGHSLRALVNHDGEVKFLYFVGKSLISIADLKVLKPGLQVHANTGRLSVYRVQLLRSRYLPSR